MAETRTIVCEDCGHDYETTRPNTKRCAKCALRLNLIYVGDRVVSCWICNRSTAPLEHSDRTCAKCAYHPVGHGEAECLYCHKTALQIRKDTPICHHCARDPEMRPKLIAGLQKGFEARKAAT